MPNVIIDFRASTGQRFQIEVDVNSTVQELKAIVAERMDDVDPATIKLVHTGRILKNEDTLSANNIVSNSTIFIARSRSKKVSEPNNSTEQASTNSSASAANYPTAASATPFAQNLYEDRSSSPFGGNMPMPDMDPEMMRQMLDSPFMQSMMNNPDFVRSIIMSNPQMKQLVEQNPELGHVISDPSFLRQSMEMMRNPELMRELQRNNDRALSNIEAIPGGFNYLRRMYDNFQSPMENAFSGGAGGRNGEEANNERLARQLNVESVPENTLNTQALPNPWAVNNNNNDSSRSASSHTDRNNTNTTTTNNNNATPTNPAAAAPANPFAALFGGLNPGSTSPFGQSQQPQQQSQQAQQAQTPFWLDPNFIQASMLLQQAMMNAQNSNNNTNSATDNTSTTNNNLFEQMFMGMGGLGSGAGGSPAIMPQQPQQQQTPTEPPEVRFREQLEQMEEMGFSEKSKNIRALLATGGNLQAAIDYLFSM